MQEIRDKLASRGVGALSDAELLAIIVEERDMAERLLADSRTLATLGECSLSRLRMVEGLGLRRAEKILAAYELGRRIEACSASNAVSISSSDDIVRIFRPIMEDLPHEECWVLYLTASNRIIERQRISMGGVQNTVVDVRLIVKRAIELLAVQIVLLHNHPSGSAKPSNADIALTNKVRNAVALLDIHLLDHIIIAHKDNYSFCDNNLL